MTIEWKKRYRHLAAFAIVVGLFQVLDESGVGATVARTSVATPAALGVQSTDDNCDQVCGPATSCSQGCWAVVDELPAFHTNCGEYAGGSSEGMCLGECGDNYCNEYNDEDADSCYTDCGACGDNYCSSSVETFANCAVDCPGSCDDGICDSRRESCETCQADCNPTMDECTGGTPGTDCGDGKVINGTGACCLPYITGSSISTCEQCMFGQQCILGFDALGGPWYECVTEGPGCEGAPSRRR